jgi:CRP/FNR family transcriptional regulator, cyclic AMP receptor protein
MPVKFELYTEKPTTELIQDLPLAQALNPQQIDILAKHFNAYLLPPGVRLLEEKRSNDYLYFVCEGTLKVTTRDAPINPGRPIPSITRGKIIGEASFFDHEDCSATVTTMEKSIVLSMSRTDFLQLGIDSPHCALAFTLEVFRLFAQRLRSLIEVMY